MSARSVITIDSHADLAGAAPVRKLVYMVLLLAVRDGATDIEFEPCPQDEEWKLRYNIGGTWYEFLPVPLRVPISQEIRSLAGLAWAHRLVGYLSRLVLGDRAALEGRMRLVVVGHAIDLRVTFGPGRYGDSGRAETVALRLAKGAFPCEDAGRIIKEEFKSLDTDEIEL